MNAPSTVPTPATPDVCTVAVLIEGRQIPGNLHLRAVTVNREFGRIPWAQLEFDDGEAARGSFPVSDNALFAPGKRIEIQLGYRSDNGAVFKGLVLKQRLKLRKSGSALHVDCYAEAVKLTRNPRSRYFADVTDSDVIEQILDSHGLAKDVEATSARHHELVQFDCTDWDFMLCRAEANGQLALVTDAGITITKPVFTGDPALRLAFGATVIELDTELDARLQSAALKAVSWSAADQQAAEAEAQEPALPAAGNVSAADLARSMGEETAEIRHGGMLGAEELQSWADARLLRMRLSRLRGRARCQGIATVQPGMLVEITGIGARFTGRLFVSGVRHTLAGGNWETDLQFGLPPESFAAAHHLRQPAAAGLVPPVPGLQTAVVTALAGDPDGEDRIRVRLPMISAADDGAWARIATLDAGNGRGTFFRPEVGDEVIVGFLSEDPRHPVILGGCHSSARPAPEPPEDKNNHKGYVSREKLKLTFDDEKKAIVAETPGGNRITLSDNAKGIKLEDQNGNTLTLDASGISLESAKDINIKGANITLDATAGFKASGAATAELKGAQAKVSGDAMAIIKGAMVQIN